MCCFLVACQSGSLEQPARVRSVSRELGPQLQASKKPERSAFSRRQLCSRRTHGAKGDQRRLGGCMALLRSQSKEEPSQLGLADKV
jgi:hypothetical protein